MAGDAGHADRCLAGGLAAVGATKCRFWIYLLSNALWTVWGLQTQAWALMLLQFGLAAMNLRGVRKNQ